MWRNNQKAKNREHQTGQWTLKKEGKKGLVKGVEFTWGLWRRRGHKEEHKFGQLRGKEKEVFSLYWERGGR